MYRMLRTNILDSSAGWSHSCWKSVAWASRIQDFYKKGWSSLFIWVGWFPQKGISQSSARAFTLAVSFLGLKWRKRARGLTTEDVNLHWCSVCNVTPTSHFSAMLGMPSPAPIRIALSEDKNSNILKIGRHSDESGKGFRSLTVQHKDF